MTERGRALLRLSMIPGLGPVRIHALVRAFGSETEVLRAHRDALAATNGIGRATAAAIVATRDQAGADADREIDEAKKRGVSIVACVDAEYPPLLAGLGDRPPVLYVRGSLRTRDADAYAVAVVGSRRSSLYGLEQSRRFATALASAGITVVSGGARGIDAAAHLGALDSGGRTIAVSGAGLSHVYPPEHGPLYDRIAEHGAVVSELPMDTPPRARNFPARNRIVSGLSLGVLVIEAGEASGALITARLAVEEHGREVMALPARADAPGSRGGLKLLQSGGAAMVLDPADVLHVIESAALHLRRGTYSARFGAPPETPAAALAPEPDDSLRSRIVRALAAGSESIDELAIATGSTVAAVGVEVTLLEIQQRVRRAGSVLELCRDRRRMP